MIGCTKLICGTATIGEAMNYSKSGEKAPAHMLQFTTDDRPLVVWNMTRRCNLSCVHCYISADERKRTELSTDEARTFIDDLAQMGCPVLLFSGGEPTLRADLCELGAYAISKGVRAVISSNGTMIDEKMAKEIAGVGFSYVGVSLDGAPETHDKFRGKKGAFEDALRGIRSCLAAGVKAGVRLTVNRANVQDLPQVLDIVEREGIPRFCMYHLVYAGRGESMVAQDLSHDDARGVIARLIDKVLDWEKRGVGTEILTTDNHADGVMIEEFVGQSRPERLADVQALQKRHGGCSAGKKMANVDYAGNVHPCQFWSGETLGNVRERPFSEIWTDVSNPLLAKLRSMPEPLTGQRCSRCRHRAVCGGCRIRAGVVGGDLWGDDPACYLTDEEIGICERSRRRNGPTASTAKAPLL